MNGLDRIDFIDNSIRSLFKRDISLEVTNILSIFRFIIKEDLVSRLSNVEDYYNYKYTHEAILSSIQTHGFFQFYLNNETDISPAESFFKYLEDKIIDMFAEHTSDGEYGVDDAMLISTEIVMLISCYLACDTKIPIELKQALHEGLKVAIKCYEHYSPGDSLSIQFDLIDKEVGKWIS